MKTKINTPQKALDALIKGQRIHPQGSFWKAFFCLMKGNRYAARRLLQSTYYDRNGDPKRPQRLQQLESLATGHAPITIESYGWVELFAWSGLSHPLTLLYKAERIQGIHGVHAEIEFAPMHAPNPLLKTKSRERRCLLELYDLEAELLLGSPLCNEALEQWLMQRKTRALEYFQTQRFCHAIPK